MKWGYPVPSNDKYPDDRPKQHRKDGVPAHEPPEELKHFFNDDGSANDAAQMLLLARKPNAPWHKTETGQKLGLYIWKISGGSFKVIGSILNTTDSRARNLKDYMEKLALKDGVLLEEKGAYIYVPMEELGDEMVRTVAQIHRRVREMIPAMQNPKEAVAMLKTLTEVGLLLQGLPTNRSASIQEPAENPKKLEREIQALAGKVDVVKERIERRKETTFAFPPDDEPQASREVN